MSLKKLIKNQTIRIDNHSRGGEIKWERSLHIHKCTNDDKSSILECEIYFADNRGIIFHYWRGNKTETLKKELKEAFEDKNIRCSFINSFYESIEPILNCCPRNDAQKARVARRAAKRIAKALGLSSYIIDEFVNEANYFFMYKLKGESYIGIDYRQQRKIFAGNNKDKILEFADVR